MHLGISNSYRMLSSQSMVRMLNIMVREALVKSVAWTFPPVSRHSSQVSTVPNSSSPRRARSRAPGT